MPKIIFRSRAKRNLKSIALYIARDNWSRAHSFVTELEDVCYSLADLLNRGAAMPTNNSDVRRLVYGNYLIFYRYHEAQDTVFIIRIDESSQDFSRIRFED